MIFSRHDLSVVLCLLAFIFFVVSSVSSIYAQDNVAVPGKTIDDHFERIYVPEGSLAEYWSHVEPGVLVDRATFEDLLKKSDEVLEPDSDQPHGIVMENVEYNVEIVGDTLKITAECRLTKLRTGWATLPLPLSGVSLLSATFDSQPAPLGMRGEQKQLTFLSDFVGSKSLTLTMSVPISRVGTDELASMTLLPNVASSMTVAIAQGRHLRINGAEVETEQDEAVARTVKIPTGGMRVIQLRWTDALGESLDESLVFAQTVYAIGVERDSLDWQTLTQIDLYGKRFTRLEFTVPNSLEITSVSVPGLQAWDLQDDPEDPNRTLITLTFREPIPQRARIEMHGVQLTQQESEWTVASLRLKGATTHTGGLAISAPSQIRIKTLTLDGIRPATRSWKPVEDYTPRGPIQFYDIWNSEFVFRITSDETSREVQAAVSHRLEISEVTSHLSSVFTLQSLFAPLFELKVDLPAGWTIADVQTEGTQLEWQYLSQGEAGSRISIPLQPPLQPGQTRSISIAVEQPFEDAELGQQATTIALPEIRIDDVKILEGSYSVAADFRLDVVPVDVKGMDPTHLGTPNERFGYRYQNAHIGGEFQIQRKPTRFNATRMTLVDVDEDSVMLSYQATLEISGGGLRNLRVTLPKKLETTAEFVAGGPFRISRQAQSTTEDETIWNLTFDRYLTGVLPLSLQVVIPSEGDEDIVIPEIFFEGAELQDDYLAFLADEDQYLDVQVLNAKGTAVSPVDPADMPIASSQGRKRVVAGYHLIEPGAIATLSIDKFDAAPIPTAIGQMLEIETVWKQATHMQQQAELTFAAVGVQNLLVKLPANARLWSATVDNVPVTARKDGDGFHIPVPPAQGQNYQRKLRLLYTPKAIENSQAGFGVQAIPAPEFAIQVGQGEIQPLYVLVTNWVVHHDPESIVMPVSDDVELAEQHSTSTWLGRVIEKIRSQSWMTLAQNLGIGLLLLLIPIGLAKLIQMGVITLQSGEVRPTLWILFGVVVVGSLGIFSLLLTKSVQSPVRIASSRSSSDYTDEYYAGAEGMVVDSEWEGQSDGAGKASNFDSGWTTNGSTSSESLKSELATIDRPADFTEPMSGPEPPLAEQPGEAKPTSEEKAKQWDSLSDRRARTAAPNAPADALGLDKKFGEIEELERKKDQLTKEMVTEEAEVRQQMEILGEVEVEPGFQQVNIDADAGRTILAQRGSSRNDGLLSLPVRLQIPGNMITTRLQSFRASSVANVRIISEEFTSQIRWLIAAVGLLLLWLIRDASRALRAAVVVALVGIPIALTGIIPEIAYPLVEGCLLGVLVGVCLWIALKLIHLLTYSCRKVCGWLWSTRHSIAATTILCVLSLSVTSSVQAKDVVMPQTQQNAQPAQQAPPVQQAEIVIPCPPPEPAKIPLVFPYKQGASPLATERVYVPKDIYLKLWKNANPDDTLESSPIDYQLSEASYSARIIAGQANAKNHTVELKARYVVRSYRNQEQLVPLPIGALLLDKVEVDGQPMAASIDNAQSPSVLITGKGLHLVDATFRFPASAIGIAGQFQLNLLPVASGAMTFELPAENLQLRINEGSIPYQLIEREGKTFAEFAITAGGALNIAWQPKVSTTQLQFLSSESTRQVLIREVGVELRYTFQFDIAQGSFSELEFEMPANVALKSLEGADLAGWQKQADGRLRVLLKRSVDDRTLLTMSLFAPLTVSSERQRFVCPDVIPQGITREIGSWAVGWESLLDVVFVETNGVRQLQNNEFRPLDDKRTISEIQRVYRFSSRPQGLTLEIKREPSQADVKQYSLVDLQPHKTHIVSIIDANLQGAARLAVDLELPENMQPIEINGDDVQDWFVTQPEGQANTVLTILFSQPRQGNARLVVRGFIQQENSLQESIPVRGVRMLGATRSTEYLAVGAAEMYGLTVAEAGNSQTIAPDRLPTVLTSVAKFPIRIGFLNNLSTAQNVQIRLKREQAQVKADSVTLIAVSEASIDYGLSLEWNISKAATDRFAFIGPKWMKDRIEFTAADLRQVITVDLDEQRTKWILETRTSHGDQFFATAVISVPYPEDRTVRTPSLQLVETEADAADDKSTAPLDIQGHYVVLANLGRQTLEPISNHSSKLVSRRELPIEIPEDLARQAVEFVRVTPQVVPSWELKPLEEQESPAATIFLAELMTVLDRQGTYRTTATYTVKNRRRQFLPIVLPEATELISVLVNGKAARATRHTIDGKSAQLIPLPPASAADLAFDVRVVTQGKLSRGFGAAWMGTSISLERPDVLSPEASAEFGIPVMHSIWKVSTPDDYYISAVRGDGSNMNETESQEVSEVRLRNRLQELSELSSIVRRKSSSYNQKLQAASNLKGLKQALENAPAQTGVSDQQRQQQVEVIDEAVDSLNRLEGSPALENGRQNVNPQSLGRLFILGCNNDILAENGKAGLGVDKASPGAEGESLDDDVKLRFDLKQLNPSKPQSETKPALKGKAAEQGQNELENRRSLLEENTRKNTEFLKQQQQREQIDYNSNGFMDPLSRSGDFDGDGNSDLSILNSTNGAYGIQPNGPPLGWRSSTLEWDDDGKPQQGRIPMFANPMNSNGLIIADEYVANQSRGGSNINRYYADVPNVAGQPNNGIPMYRGHHYNTGDFDDLMIVPNNPQRGLERQVELYDFAIVGQDDVVSYGRASGEATGKPTAVIPQQWTTAGGLSIPVSLPTYENVTVFSKVGGNPQLTIRVQSRTFLQTGLGWVWTILCGAFVLWLLLSCRALAEGRRVRETALGLMIAGLVGFAVLSGLLAWFGLLLAALSSIVYVVAPRRGFRKAEQA